MLAGRCLPLLRARLIGIFGVSGSWRGLRLLGLLTFGARVVRLSLGFSAGLLRAYIVDVGHIYRIEHGRGRFVQLALRFRIAVIEGQAGRGLLVPGILAGLLLVQRRMLVEAAAEGVDQNARQRLIEI